jgi:uncharacterized protein involved in outer membrane biogenesis
MTEAVQGRNRRPAKLWIGALALAILVSFIVIPPLVNVNRYKSRITQALSNSLGRPVHLSQVELHILPRPGFVITNLTVEEDPQYGAEPVLHANSVTASIRLFSLWRGRLEIGRISVDEASLNLVHAPTGQWNLDTLFRTATQSQAGDQRRRSPFPYLEATNSRINIKQGVEKLPYSLVSADLALWQEEPGDWRVRLKGQPARTDVNLDLGDTGIVQLEGRMRRALEKSQSASAPDMRTMPVHVEMEWRNAQLGQLSRLLIGSDPGWRGDLTAEVKLDGTAESAQMTTRLRAAGVHRAEFAPAAPLDFDANCGFTYHYSAQALEKLVCDSPLGDGRLRVEGNMPGNGLPDFSLELQRIPAQAVLDTLRTMRNEFGAGLEAGGTLSGKLVYNPAAPAAIATAADTSTHHRRRHAAAKQPSPVAGPLSGSIELDDLRIRGGSLTQPIQIQKAVFQPDVALDGKGQVLSGTANVPAGIPTPLVLTARLRPGGYQVTARGLGTPARIRQLAQAAGLQESSALDGIAGEAVTVDLAIEGPWLPAPEAAPAENAIASAAPAVESPGSAPLGPPIDLPLPDRLTGTVTLRNANWKTDALATPLQLSQATLHLGGGATTWDPVEFAYGPLKGTAQVVVPVCAAESKCVPIVNLAFPELDAAELQSTLLGAKTRGTLLSSVIARLTPSSARKWPTWQGTVKAASLLLGPVKLSDVRAEINVTETGAELTSADAGLLGGQIHLHGNVENGEKPGYKFEGHFQKMSLPALCQLLQIKCTGTTFDGDGKVELAGYTGTDLANSAKGTLHFVGQKGAVTKSIGKSQADVPQALARFDRWTADAEIAPGAVTLKQSQIQQGKRTGSVSASVTFGDPPTISFSSPESTASAKK